MTDIADEPIYDTKDWIFKLENSEIPYFEMDEIDHQNIKIVFKNQSNDFVYIYQYDSDFNTSESDYN